jgi:hypothetical protein
MDSQIAVAILGTGAGPRRPRTVDRTRTSSWVTRWIGWITGALSRT